MYTMKQACEATGMNYEALKFYCNEGLVPNVKRDKINRRVFDEHDIAWIKSLSCLKKCGMSLAEMKHYLALCLEGKPTIPERQIMLEEKRKHLLQELQEVQASLDYLDWKQNLYNDVLSGKTEYVSNLIKAIFLFSRYQSAHNWDYPFSARSYRTADADHVCFRCVPQGRGSELPPWRKPYQ